MFGLLNNKKRVNILIGLFIITFVVWRFVFAEAEQSDILEINFYDIGQGDSIFIEMPNGKQILIDGGPDSTILEKIGREMAFYDRTIDVVILTHPEYDHINGLIEVIKRYNIGTIIYTGVVRDTSVYKEFIKIIEQKNIPVYIAQLGGQIDFGNNIKMDILYPFENLRGLLVSNTNNSSIVSKLIYNNFEVLFTGDIEKSIERKLINAGINLKADILKVAHHGSKTSSDENFLRAVSSLINIIQAGKDNKYGHPHDEVLARMTNVFVTGNLGDIKLLTNGKNIYLND